MNWSGPPILAVQSPNAPTPTHKATGSTADATTRCTSRRTAAKLFWSATVYDADTRCLIDNDQQRGDRGSRDVELQTNDDGSVDLYFGPSAPSGGSPLGADHPRTPLVLLLPFLRPTGTVLRPLLETRRHHPRRAVGALRHHTRHHR